MSVCAAVVAWARMAWVRAFLEKDTAAASKNHNQVRTVLGGHERRLGVWPRWRDDMLCSIVPGIDPRP